MTVSAAVFSYPRVSSRTPCISTNPANERARASSYVFMRDLPSRRIGVKPILLAARQCESLLCDRQDFPAVGPLSPSRLVARIVRPGREKIFAIGRATIRPTCVGSGYSVPRRRISLFISVECRSSRCFPDRHVGDTYLSLSSNFRPRCQVGSPSLKKYKISYYYCDTEITSCALRK